MAGSSDYITLRGGFVASVAALRVAWALEHRGFSFELRGEDLYVRPGSALTEQDLALIRAHKADLRAIVAYEAPEVAM